MLRRDALAAVGAMAALRVLNLSACAGCSDAAVAPLSRLAALSELNLAATDVTEARAACLWLRLRVSGFRIYSLLQPPGSVVARGVE